MLTNGVGDVIDELIALVRTLHFGPIESADAAEGESKKAQHVDAWQAAVKRIGDAGIEAVRGGRNIVVVRKSRLVEPVVTKPCLIDPSCVGCPYPVHPGHLRASVNEGQPLGLQLRSVLY